MGTRICQICGDRFYPANSRQKYCSDECRKEKVLEQRRKHKEKAKDKPPAVKSNGPKIDAYSAEARRRHISYGALQAERYIKKLREG